MHVEVTPVAFSELNNAKTGEDSATIDAQQVSDNKRADANGLVYESDSRVMLTRGEKVSPEGAEDEGGYEQTSAGQSSTGTVSQDTLLAGIEGNASALQQTAQAQEARTSGSKGGGGATTTANGAVGLGYANS